MSWTATLHPNPYAVTFLWKDGRLFSSESSMLAAVERLAEHPLPVAATPTGPFAPRDLSIPHVAFRLVVELALLVGLSADDVDVHGDGWWWPEPDPAQNPYGTTDTAQPEVVY